MAEAKKTVDEKEIETKEKIENIKNMEKYRENTLEIKQDILDEKKEILENLEKEKKDIANKIDQLTEEIIEEEKKNDEKKDKEEEIKTFKYDENEIILPIKKDEKKDLIKEENEEIDSEEQKITIKPTKNEETTEEKTKEEAKVPLTIVTTSSKEKKEDNELKELHKNTETVIINTNNEIEKEELEDKDYDKYAKQIDDLLYDIEMYKIKNEDTITPKEKEKINQEKNKLKSLKNKLENQKELDIEKEKRELEAEITESEIFGIQEELKQLHIDHQEEANDKIIEKLAKMESENDKKLAEIEQQLIKSKLRKAARAAEIPSILALPFIRHKYFFYFTIGLFVNNHFNFLNAILKRKTVQYKPIDLTEIKNGYDALDKALDQTYENLVYLDYLENESISKFPTLKDDKEFTKYILRIRTKLNNNYEKLQKKQKMINKYIKKVDKKNKVFKKYKLVKDDKAT